MSKDQNVQPVVRMVGDSKLAKIISSSKIVPPVSSIYDMSIELNNGDKLSFKDLEGKYILLVNTASECGFTKQYEAIQAAHEKYSDKLAIIGFPANNFGAQEPGTDSEIQEFCKVNYGVTFPIAKKKSVLNEEQQPVYQWLTDVTKNGWNGQQPEWNFSKYLISPEGNLTHYLGSAVSPSDQEFLELIK